MGKDIASTQIHCLNQPELERGVKLVSTRRVWATALWRLKQGTVLGILAVALTACGFVDEGVNKSEPPIPGDDFYGLKEGESIAPDASTGVLANDSDASGAALTARLISGPAYATDSFTLNSDGSFLYEHNGSEPQKYDPVNEDSFVYVANDGVKDSENKKVVIGVTPVNDPPVIVGLAPNSLESPEDAIINMGVTLQVQDPDNDFPADFTFTITDGANYDVSGSNITPAQDYFGTISGQVTINDGTMPSQDFPFSIAVMPVNDAPVISGQNAVTTPEEMQRTIVPGDLIFDDVDNPNNTLTLAVVDPGVNADYTANGNTIEPNDDFFGTLQVPVTLSDGDKTTPFTLNVTVTGVNDVPIVSAGPIPVSTTEDTPRAIVLTDLTVTDPDNVAADLQVMLLQPANGANYTVMNNTIVVPATNFNGALTVPLAVNDGIGSSATFNLAVNVASVNDAPAINSAAITTATAGVAYSYDVNAADPADPGDTLTYSLNTFPAGMTINAATGLISWPAPVAGNHPVVVQVTDNGIPPLNATQSFTIAVNGPPVINSAAIITAAVGTAYSYDVNAVDPNAGDVLTYSLNTAPAGMTINAGTGLISWTPAVGQSGNQNVEVQVTDNGNPPLSDTQSFTLAVNGPPVINSTAVTTASVGVAYSYDVDATDPNAGDVLTYSLNTAPAGMTINATTGLISWPTPVAGSHNVVVQVTDNGNPSLNTTQAFIISSNGIPVINSTAVTTAAEGVAYSYDVNASDPNAGDVLTFSLNTAPAGMTINATTGLISWTPAVGQAGNQNVEVQVTDNGTPPLNATQNFSITVNGAPVINTSPVTTATENVLYQYDVDATEPNAGQTLSYSLINPPTGMTIDSGTGLISWTPAVGQAGNHGFSVQVTDNGTPALSDTQIVNITVGLAVAALGGNPGDPTTGDSVILVIDSPAGPTCWTTPQEQVLNNLLPGEPALSAPLTYTLVSQATNGEANVDATGQFTYTPGLSRPRGRDSFVYQVADASGDSRIRTATVITNFKIMPLGDSVTTGVSDAADAQNPLPVVALREGYRKPLYEALMAAGYGFDFVGGQNHGDGVADTFDTDNEGHDSWTALEMALGSVQDPVYPDSGIYYWLTQNPADVVLLHTGTDVVETTTDGIEAILDAIDRWETDTGNPVTVMLASTIDQNPPSSDVAAFNSALQTFADARIASSDDSVVVVDLHAALLGTDGQPDPTLYGDNLHPNKNGYQQITDAWLNPLSKVLDQCP